MKTIIALGITILIAAPLSTPVSGVACARSEGDTKMGKMVGAMDLTDPKKQASFTDAKATDAIKNGVKQNGKTTMKAFAGKLTDDEIKALVAYVRTLKK